MNASRSRENRDARSLKLVGMSRTENVDLASDRCGCMQGDRDLGGKVGNGGFNGQSGCSRFGSD
jgi:hypothetical protein